ncbi:MAG: exodeoxyribonuclease III [Betaproteobacteria bacterium]|nr:exodeoxyribonuclease III [Betaproteobacteria bacterium]
MKLATWNVNSLKVRLPHLLDWLAAAQPDVVCLQETKLTDDAFPAAEIAAAGYQAAWSGQKTYNGVALLSRAPLSSRSPGRPKNDLAPTGGGSDDFPEPGALTEVQAGIPGFEDEQKRVLAATVDGVRVVCVYIPNGQAVDSDKYHYKLRWLGALTAWLADELKRHPRLALLGDYNIAPDDRDVHDPAAWEGQILVSERERARFQGLLDLGLQDAFRRFEQPEKSFSWWDYRAAGFRRNLGMRIDHILLSAPLAAGCTACVIDKAPRKLERPSDHTPVWAETS